MEGDGSMVLTYYIFQGIYIYLQGILIIHYLNVINLINESSLITQSGN